MADSRNLELPEPSHGDAAHAFVRAALSAVPVVGGPAVELFSAVITPPLQRRLQEWMHDVARAIDDLERSGIVSLDQIAQNEVFIDTLLHASQAALRTHQAEKRAALRNAILNAALPNPPDESLQQMIVSLVDQYTPWHLQLLEFARDPREWFRRRNRPVPSGEYMAELEVIHIAFPETKDRDEFIRQVWKDLYQDGLVYLADLNTTWEHPHELDVLISSLGHQFLRFIERPA
jgi:hypothetical protein